jgi:hypothetical protein
MVDDGTGGQATRYVLLHLTNSDDGRDLMKECAWSVSPAGGFMVRRSDNPDQQFLIKPEPDLRPLRDWIISRLSRRRERCPSGWPRKEAGRARERHVLHLWRRRSLDSRRREGRHPQNRRHTRSDQQCRLFRPVQRWRRWNDAVDNAVPALGDERTGGVHDVVERSVSVLELIDQFTEHRAGCLESMCSPT